MAGCFNSIPTINNWDICNFEYLIGSNALMLFIAVVWHFCFATLPLPSPLFAPRDLFCAVRGLAILVVLGTIQFPGRINN